MFPVYNGLKIVNTLHSLTEELDKILQLKWEKKEIYLFCNTHEIIFYGDYVNGLRDVPSGIDKLNCWTDNIVRNLPLWLA